MTATKNKSGALQLVCVKCRRTASFPGENRPLAAIEAQKAGWQFRIEGGEVCPRCPK